MVTEKFPLPQPVLMCLDKLNQNGFEAYLVGGCVRDQLLGQNPKDMDITTDARPEEVMDVFCDYRVIATGIKHGTVTVIIKSLPVEITTYRTYKEPVNNLEADLAKRDFTINALAYHAQTGVIDYYHGLDDLAKKIIRSVGDPKDRFAEDGLRILRALRMASVLGFAIEGQTNKAMLAQKELLSNIAGERVAAELTRLLCGEKAAEIILGHTEILGVIMPDLLTMKGFQQNNIYHTHDVLSHTAYVVQNLPAIPHLRLAGLFHDMGKPGSYSQDDQNIGHFYGHQELGSQIAKKALLQLKFDSFTIERVETLVKHHDIALSVEKKHIKRWLNRLSPEVFQELLILKKADILAQNPEFYDRLKIIQAVEELTQTILSEGSCFTLKNLQIKGNDLLDMGIQPGKQIGWLLDQLLAMVMDEQVENDYMALKQYARRIVKTLPEHARRNNIMEV